MADAFEQVVVLMNENRVNRSVAPKHETVVPAAEGKRVLLVEDDDVVATAIGMLLDLSGVITNRVSRGLEAPGAIEAFRPDAVLLDLGLPDIGGEAVYALIEKKWPTLPVVFASGHSDGAELNHLTSRPHIRFLAKPFEITALLNALNKVTGS